MSGQPTRRVETYQDGELVEARDDPVSPDAAALDAAFADLHRFLDTDRPTAAQTRAAVAALARLALNRLTG